MSASEGSEAVVASAANTAPTPAEGLERVLERAAAWRGQGKADEAAALLAKVLRGLGPRDAGHAPPLLRSLGDLCLNSFGDAAAAAALFRQLASVQPSMHADLAAIVTELYLGGPSAVAMAARMCAVAARHMPETARAGNARTKTRSAKASGGTGTGRLRIGFISNSLHASPVAFFCLGAMRVLSRHADLVLFSRGSKHDWANQWFRELAHEWHDCAALDVEALRTHLAHSELDALIDLSGWTDPAALKALCTRPAPRMLKWVGGQAMTTGLPCFDGMVSDTWQVPAGSQVLYAEPILRCEEGYVTYTSAPYCDLRAQASRPPKPRTARPGHYALVSNPAKISVATGAMLRDLRPKKVYLVDQRWRYRQTRLAAAERLGSVMDVAEFVTPPDHPTYLEALRNLDATVVDTAPYSMGLSAVELRLLGVPVAHQVRPATASMCERHCAGHMHTAGFAHHEALALRILQWCQP